MKDEPTEISDVPGGRFDPRAGISGQFHPSDRDTVEDSESSHRDRVGNFEIISLLGRGAFGSVYKARDTNLGRDVAIKFLHDPLDPRRQKLFEREARALAALSKEAAIVEVYQWGEHAGQNYIVLEFVDGSAEKLLSKYPAGLPVIQALGLAADCAEALHAAHVRGILHRDIKPANILVEPATGKAKVADFGLARLDDDSGFTLAGAVSGSPPYMSPEQASGSDLDGRSDLFSLGVTLYEMLSCARPFEGKSATQIMDHIRNNTRTPLKHHRPDLSENICEIVEKATAHDPKDRFQTGNALAEALRETIIALERSGQAETRSVRGIKPWRKPATWTASVAVLLAVLFIAIGINFGRGGTEGGDGLFNRQVAIAQVNDDIAAGNLDSAASTLHKVPDGEKDLIVRAYLQLIDEKQDADGTDAAMVSARNIHELRAKREELRKASGDAPDVYDGWTSLPLTFFMIPTEFSPKSVYTKEANLLEEAVDWAMDDLYVNIEGLNYLNRLQIQDALREIELGELVGDASKNVAAFEGARFMVGVRFSRLGDFPDQVSLSITEVGSTNTVRTGSGLAVVDYSSPVALLEATAKQVQSTLLEAYPLQGRVHRSSDAARINIGAAVGLKPGMRFSLRHREYDTPLPDVVATVSAVLDENSAEISLEGMAIDELAATPDEGFFAQRLEEGIET